MTFLEVTLISILAVLYVTMLVVLGVTTFRKGRMLFFVLGFFFPLFWIVGAVMPPTRAAADLLATQAEHDRLYAR